MVADPRSEADRDDNNLGVAVQEEEIVAEMTAAGRELRALPLDASNWWPAWSRYDVATNEYERFVRATYTL